MTEDFGKTLVIGATGRIGAVLRQRWPDGAAIWHSRRPQPGFECFDPLADPRAFVRAAYGARAILCLAGVVTNRVGPEGYGANVTLARASVTAAAEVGARVVLASSAAVYGNQSEPLVETGLLLPANEYGASKARMEQEAATLGHKLGVPVTSLRIGNIAGLDAILGGWRPGFALDRFADGTTPRRSYIGLQMLAQSIDAVIRHPAPPEIVNIAEPGPIEMGALLDAANLQWTPQPAPETAIPAVELDVLKLAALFPALPARCDAGTLVADWRAFVSAEARS